MRQDDVYVGKSGLTREGGLGLMLNSGNTENNNLNTSFKALYTTGPWRHEFNLDARQTTVEDETTAKRVLVDEKSSYTFSNRVYAFSAIRYDQDRFSGFDYKASGTAGIGWHVLNNETNRLDLDIGAGANTGKLQETGKTEQDTIGSLSLQFTSQLTATTQLSQDMVIESSRISTNSESRTGLRVAMNSKLALQLLYSVKKNSNPPPDTLPVDRHTAISLIYAF